MKCFYHHDMDGKCAGAIVKYKFPHCEMFVIDYKDKFPIEIIQPNETIYIVDFSISPNEMREILKITDSVYWIDHHKTAIEKYKDFEREIFGLRVNDSPSGCECTWMYLYPDKEIPMGVKLIGDRDTWTWKYGDQTKYYHFAAQSYDTNPDSEFWQFVFTEKDKDMYNMGLSISNYEENRWKEYKRDYSYEIEFEGYKCIVMNSGMCNSPAFGKNNYDIMMSYVYDGTQYKVSLYTTKVDVSIIAKKYGGGGHVKAAGFQCKKLPWSK